jgi:hypothetical protein
VGHGKHAPVDVVDANAAPVVTGSTIDENDGNTASQELELRHVGSDRRHQDAAHALLGE